MSNSFSDWLDFCSKHDDVGVAEELQRLASERDSSRAVNAELVAALENIVNGSGSSYRELFIQARVAIARARKVEQG